MGPRCITSMRPNTRKCMRVSITNKDQFWAEHGRRIDWIKPFTKVKNTSFDPHNVSIKWFEDGITNVALQLHRPSSRRRAATRPRSSGKATTRTIRSTSPIRQLHDEVCRFANVLQGAWRQEGRPRHHLSADDPRGGLRHARLRAHRRHPFGRVRRLLAGLARRPHRGLQVEASSSPPTKACAAAARCR